MISRLFARQWCGTQLNWWLLLDEFDPGKVDIIVQGDESFSPLTAGDSQLQQALMQQLKHWHSSTNSNFDSLIQVLLQLYLQHNKQRIAATVHDERILFELSMVDELGCDEVLLTGECGAHPASKPGIGTEQSDAYTRARETDLATVDAPY